MLKGFYLQLRDFRHVDPYALFVCHFVIYFWCARVGLSAKGATIWYLGGGEELVDWPNYLFCSLSTELNFFHRVPYLFQVCLEDNYLFQFPAALSEIVINDLYNNTVYCNTFVLRCVFCDLWDTYRRKNSIAVFKVKVQSIVNCLSACLYSTDDWVIKPIEG